MARANGASTSHAVHVAMWSPRQAGTARVHIDTLFVCVCCYGWVVCGCVGACFVCTSTRVKLQP